MSLKDTYRYLQHCGFPLSEIHYVLPKLWRLSSISPPPRNGTVIVTANDVLDICAGKVYLVQWATQVPHPGNHGHTISQCWIDVATGYPADEPYYWRHQQ